jgi:hypothetical protein
MGPIATREYKRLRAKRWVMKDAVRAAQVFETFSLLETEGLVKLVAEPDDEGYDASFVDTWTHLSDARRAKEKERIEKKACDEGTYTLCSYIRSGEADSSPDWELADSCGGFIGRDWKDSGYDTDIMLGAIHKVGCANIGHPGFGGPKDKCEHPDCVIEFVLAS